MTILEKINRKRAAQRRDILLLSVGFLFWLAIVVTPVVLALLKK